MRAIVMFIALLLPIGLITPLGAANAASNSPAPAPTAPGQPVFVPIDRTHVLLALPPRAAPNATQPKSSAGPFVAPSGAGAIGAMPFYPPPGTTQ